MKSSKNPECYTYVTLFISLLREKLQVGCFFPMKLSCANLEDSDYGYNEKDFLTYFNVAVLSFVLPWGTVTFTGFWSSYKSILLCVLLLSWCSFGGNQDKSFCHLAEITLPSNKIFDVTAGIPCFKPQNQSTL